jgi:MOSC domain-containing protein YiiM
MGRDYGRNIRAVARLVSLNVSLPEEVVWRGRGVRTAFFKKPVVGPVFLSTLHLDGDGVGDPRFHGGREKAVYLYPFEHYAYWEKELRRDDLSPGSFGENFTTEGLLEEEVRIGDSFDVGSARVRVTQPRTPCAKLGMRMGSMAFVRRFAASGRSGFYLAVVREGVVASGEPVVRLDSDPAQPTVAEVFRAKASG